jgi:hypothetical protein
MLAQTKAQFTWLLFLDVTTPEWILAALQEAAQQALFNVDLVIIDGLFDPASVRTAVAERQGESLVVTTRLDNDDIVAIDFIETIQRNVVDREFLLLNLISGSQQAAGRPYRRPYPANPFISLVENCAEHTRQTVFATEHSLMPSLGPVRNIRTNHPMWMQVVHGSNIANEIVGIPMRAGALRRWFPYARLENWTLGAFVYTTLVRSTCTAIRLIRKPDRVLALLQVMKAGRTN